MTEPTATRRPGRPKGSKNKPKEPDTTEPTYDTTIPKSTSKINLPDWTPEIGRQPSSVDLTKPLSYIYSPEDKLFPAGQFVHFKYKGAFSAASGEWEDDAVWPSQWQLPRLGESVTLAPGKGGRVVEISYELHNGRIVIGLGS